MKLPSVPSVLFNARFAKLFVLALLFFVFGATERSLAVLWGNVYEVGNGGTGFVDTTHKQWVTFTATENMTVSGARIYNSTAMSGSPELVVDIRGVDGGSGDPTGPVLGSGTFSPTGTGFHSVSISSTSLTSGQVYAMEVSTATPGASFNWRHNGGSTGGIQPYGAADSSFSRGYNTSGPWEGSFVWVLDTNIGRTVGQPYVSATAANVGSTALTYGQRFKYDQTAAGGDSFVESITLRLNVNVPASADEVTVKLINDSGAVLASTTRDMSGESGVANYQFDLNSPVNLTDGEEYYVGMYSDNSLGDSVKWYGWNTLNDSDYIGSSFQGADANGVY